MSDFMTAVVVLGIAIVMSVSFSIGMAKRYGRTIGLFSIPVTFGLLIGAYIWFNSNLG